MLTAGTSDRHQWAVQPCIAAVCGYIISLRKSSTDPQSSSSRSGVRNGYDSSCYQRKSYTVDADPQTSLLTVLREHLDLTGSKYGCGEGQCGACTVLIDGKAQRSCITRVGTVSAKANHDDRRTRAGGSTSSRCNEAFLDVGAMQCGYCTSGMIMSAVALLKKNPRPRRARSSTSWTAMFAAAERIRGS